MKNTINKSKLSKSALALAGMAIAATSVAGPASASTLVQTSNGPVLTGVERSSTKISLPLQAGTYRLTSEAGPRCIPIYAGGSVHFGQDFGAAEGSPIYSVADGVVTSVKAGNDNVAGHVIIKHVINGETFYSYYVHMWDGSDFAYVGKKVASGEKIGEVGNSGASTSAHLHLEIWGEGGVRTSGNSPFNPVQLLEAWGSPDLNANATADRTGSTPETCTYYLNSASVLKDAPSDSARTVLTMPYGSKVVSRPGDATSTATGWLRVKYGQTVGWMPQLNADPSYKGTPPAIVGGASSSNLTGLTFGPIKNWIIPVQASSTVSTPAPAPTPVVTSPTPAPKPVVTPPAPSPTTTNVTTTNYTVKAGDNLYRIALNNDTTVTALQKLNNLSGTIITVGDVLKVPTTSTPAPAPAPAPSATTVKSYTVKAGDNLYRIAWNNGTTFDAIQKLNNLSGTIITVGDVLKVPTSTTTAKSHTVEAGDTFYKLSKEYNTTISTLREINPQVKNDILYVGDILNIR